LIRPAGPAPQVVQISKKKASDPLDELIQMKMKRINSLIPLSKKNKRYKTPSQPSQPTLRLSTSKSRRCSQNPLRWNPQK